MSVVPRIEVSWEDQKNINLFNRLHIQHVELQAQVKVHKKRLEDLEDASNELILVDEETVRYTIGSNLFVHVSPEEAEEKLQKEIEKVQNEVDTTESELADLERQMEELKSLLYSKFGNTINLES